MKREPPRGSTCAYCKKRLTIPDKTYASLDEYAEDAFCSRVCVEKFHGHHVMHMTGTGRRVEFVEPPA